AGPHTYLWTTGSSNPTISNLDVGTYSVMVTDALGCYETRSFTLSDPYVISFGGIIPPTCPGDSDGKGIVNSSGCPCMFNSCVFLWDNGITGKSNDSLSSGWQTVSILHPDGCLVVDSVYVPEPLPIIIDTNIVNNICYGASLGSIELLNSNYQPVVYNWSNGETTQLASDLSAGTYSVVVSDARGCIDSLEFLITQPAELLVSTAVTNVLCNGNSNGEIQIQGQGGTGNYTYWLNQQTTSSLNTNLTAGVYSIYISDANNCTSQAMNVTVSEPQVLTATLSSTPQVISLDGTASVNVSGGTAPYSYEWDDTNSQTESMAVYLNSGWYSVNVTDANGCQLTDSVFVEIEVGIEEFNLTGVLLYPNPAETVVFLSKQVSNVIIIDATGRQIISFSDVTDFNVEQLASGPYQLIITNEGKRGYLSFVRK
ncbi:MAG: T9SS type A sorting domain-containing protein, partial [Bacteroidetes bacterium]|nr:T9SS type A sorting domain-containing protein [Bacteroidota bacterium]